MKKLQDELAKIKELEKGEFKKGSFVKKFMNRAAKYMEKILDCMEKYGGYPPG